MRCTASAWCLILCCRYLEKSRSISSGLTLMGMWSLSVQISTATSTTRVCNCSLKICHWRRDDRIMGREVSAAGGQNNGCEFESIHCQRRTAERLQHTGKKAEQWRVKAQAKWSKHLCSQCRVANIELFRWVICPRMPGVHNVALYGHL